MRDQISPAPGFYDTTAEDLARPAPSSFDFPDSPLARAARQPLMLGLFLDLYQKPPRNGQPDTDWEFESLSALVRQAEALGFDSAFSRMQWFPKAGRSTSLDAFLAFAALAPITSRILLISSIHVLYGPWHPVHLAKYGSTLDHITGGRWGINILTGHRAVEHEMFGQDRIEHDRRYALASEFFDVVERLWVAQDDLSYRGTSPWQVRNGYIAPKPRYGRPIHVAATGSDAGFDFCARHADLAFLTSPDGPGIDRAAASLRPHIADLKARAARNGRGIRVLVNALIVAAQTEEAAQARADGIAQERSAPRAEFDSDAHAWRQRRTDTPEQRISMNIQIIGTPDSVTRQLGLLKAAGVDGVQISFHDWAADLDFFGAYVLPLLRQAGLRL